MVNLDIRRQCGFSDIEISFAFGNINGYDLNSFRRFDEAVEILEASEQPVIIRADSIFLGDGKRKFENIGGGDILTFHGFPTKDFWRQKFYPYANVEEIINEITKYVNLEFCSCM